jgi:hypothetical protein
MNGYNSATQVWQSSVSGGGSTTVPSGGSVWQATDAPGTAGNIVPITYLSGLSTAKLYFPEMYGNLIQMSICTVTRYTSTLNRMRIFQPYKADVNWLHGHWSGYSGVAYYNGWLTTALSTTATKWVSTCSSFDTGSDAYTLDVNGHPYSNSLAGLAVIDQLTINGNIYVDAEWSDFGVAEMMTWDRALTAIELNEAQKYLTTKYGLADAQPPAPPVPAAPQPPTAPLASSLMRDMVAWYNMDSYKATTELSGVWTSAVNPSMTASVAQIDVVTDAPNAASNTVPITYISGPSTTKIIFPELYGSANLIEFSICTVTRYTSALPQFRMRIFQDHLSQTNFLHGHWCVPVDASRRQSCVHHPRKLCRTPQLTRYLPPCRARAPAGAGTAASRTTISG